MSAVGDAIDDARAAVAEAAGDFMPDVCTVKRPTATQGTSGGTRLAYSDQYANVPCKYTAKLKGGPSAERMSGGAVAAFVDGELSLPYELAGAAVVVQAKDRVVMATRGGRPALTFEVVAPGEDSMGVLQVCPVVVKG